jgi:hypothetical protein
MQRPWLTMRTTWISPAQRKRCNANNSGGKRTAELTKHLARQIHPLSPPGFRRRRSRQRPLEHGRRQQRSNQRALHLLRSMRDEMHRRQSQQVSPTRRCLEGACLSFSNGTSDRPNSSLATTDSEPGKNDGSYPEMEICPLFFTAAETKNRLDSKKYDKDGWCASGQGFKAFETGGHTLLHEMTHLDALAKGAGSPER